MPNFQDEFKSMLDDTLEQTGASIEKASDEVARFMSERTLHLSTITTEPGFGQAVTAEVENVAMFAGLRADDAAAAHDQRMVGWIGGALRIASLALA